LDDVAGVSNVVVFCLVYVLQRARNESNSRRRKALPFIYEEGPSLHLLPPRLDAVKHRTLYLLELSLHSHKGRLSLQSRLQAFPNERESEETALE
jgi:hypothetical protein